ncbi:hypothetical protein ACFC1I_05360 [Microbacterium sp. NPDC056044]|uniref:hypothetical protein n=1 Tax=Microbacterium sp. NPDC056044 TaxID=3345690 RepID=UPI0035DC2B70
MRRAQLPDHTCGWSPQYRRTVANHECARCVAEDELILDTQKFDQRKRSWIYRPARVPRLVSADDIPSGDSLAANGDEPAPRRETFVPLGDAE